MQSHGVRCMWFRVLLAVQERDYRFALFESIRMYILGHKAMVEEEEAFMATRNTRGCTCNDCSSRWNCRSRNDYR